MKSGLVGKMGKRKVYVMSDRAKDKIYEAGLVLEGGGMRGMYTAGILDLFIDKGIYFRNCYGVSAGATQCCSYLSKQKGRAARIYMKYMKDKRYASFGNLIKTGYYFGKEFSLKTIPDELLPYDYETFDNQKSNFYAVATDCKTGKPAYLKVENMRRDIDMVWASCSLPMISRMVEFGGEKYLDGGVADSIPVIRALKDKNEKAVVILTRDATYRKSPNKLMPLIKLIYRKYPEFVKVMKNRHDRYNKTLMQLEKLEKEGKIFVIRPKKAVEIGRLEKDAGKMKELYDIGYNDAKECVEAMLGFLTTERNGG